VINRRRFLQLGAAGLVLPPFRQLQPNSETFYVAVIADTHIIDSFYRGPEGNEEDTESIYKTMDRLTAARDLLNGLQPALDRVFVVGDFFHDYPSTDLDFYFKNTTRIDHAKALVDGFRMPVHVGFGNHDYAVPQVSREGSHELFRRKLSSQPYYAIDHRGWKFVHVNNFLGTTWEVGHPNYQKGQGSLGENQLNWLDAQLAEGKPTFVFVHYPLRAIAATEYGDLGLHTLLKRHAATVQRVISGHWHRWVDLGTDYGPKHLVIAATRYDPDAYLILEIDSKAGTHRPMNLNLVEWDTHFSRPYVPSKG
jgi:hypothetical protein